MTEYKIDDIQLIVEEIFIARNVSKAHASRVARALIHAEIMGQAGHGLSRVESYAAQAKIGKIKGQVQPMIEKQSSGVIVVNAQNGFAYPAIDLAVEALIEMTENQAIACAGIVHSHHCGQLSAFVETLANQGRVGLMLANTPSAIAPWGGAQPIYGTNPIGFSAPRAHATPIVIDMALSKVARGKIVAAKQRGEPIPEGWALDEEGNPTTDPDAALKGTMLPIADAKGAALALMVEILAASLVGAHYGFQASSFLDAEGSPPDTGQFIIAINPHMISQNGYFSHIEALIDAILSQSGTRLPGVNAIDKRKQALALGRMVLSKSRYEELQKLRDE